MAEKHIELPNSTVIVQMKAVTAELVKTMIIQMKAITEELVKNSQIEAYF